MYTEYDKSSLTGTKTAIRGENRKFFDLPPEASPLRRDPRQTIK